MGKPNQRAKEENSFCRSTCSPGLKVPFPWHDVPLKPCQPSRVTGASPGDHLTVGTALLGQGCTSLSHEGVAGPKIRLGWIYSRRSGAALAGHKILPLSPGSRGQALCRQRTVLVLSDSTSKQNAQTLQPLQSFTQQRDWNICVHLKNIICTLTTNPSLGSSDPSEVPEALERPAQGQGTKGQGRTLCEPWCPDQPS